MKSSHRWRSPAQGILMITLAVAALAAFGIPEADPNLEFGPPEGEAQRFFESVDVDVVDLHVTVTDRQGQPVRGLTLEDFQVFENGQEVELTNFFAIAGGETTQALRPRLDSLTDSSSQIEARVSTAGQSAMDVGHVVLFVDHVNIQPNNRRRLFDSLRQHLQAALSPGIRTMVVSLGRQLEVELPFSNDREQVFAVLDRLEKESTLHTLLDSDRRMYLSRLQGSILRRYAPQASGVVGDPHFDIAVNTALQLAESIRPLSEQRTQKVRATLAALAAFCDTLGGVSGRKALVYLSDGLPMRPADSLHEAWTSKHQSWVLANASDIRQFSAYPEAVEVFQRIMSSFGSSEFDLTEAFQRLTQRANDNRVVFYPISDSGEESMHVSAASSGGAFGAGSGSAMTNSQTLESFSRDASLQLMAENTGGLALTRTSNLGELLARVSRDFESYYSLGYRPSLLVGEGDRRRIEVKVAREDVLVRYGKGYRPKNWRQQLGSMALASVQFETQQNPLNVRVESLEQSAAGERVRVPILLKVPFEQIRLIHQDGHYVAQLTALLVVQGEDGRVSDTVRVDFPIKIPDQRILEARAQVAGYVIELEVEKGTTRIALGLRDHIAQVDSTVNLELVAGKHTL